ncbi:7514_t:CDS:2 [Ambispora gerdemannii]|uniref:7514_t:CDS:1 n=1 Tax=Ambispora gerdemannii TaxID=144530 RepID=A0A9N9GGM8_9GLOM|nr:7514_t:CDS:2 [Ambispora gerdemannii]
MSSKNTSKNTSTDIFLVSPTKLISAVINFFTYDYSKQADDKFFDDSQSDFLSKCSTPSCEEIKSWPGVVAPFDNEELVEHFEIKSKQQLQEKKKAKKFVKEKKQHSYIPYFNIWWTISELEDEDEEEAKFLENPFYVFDETPSTSSFLPAKAQTTYTPKSYFRNDDEDDDLQNLQYNEECSFFGSIFGSGYSADEDTPRGQFPD